jgi:HD-like signal output (HDOD) protein
MPAVVLQVVQICASDRDDAIQLLEQAISRDPGFAARMISTANSPAFAAGGTVSSIKSAIMMLGLKGVRCLALSVGATDLFRFSNKEDMVRAQNWWRLSCASALSARYICKATKKPYGEEAYLAGLLHAAGKNQLLSSDSQSYAVVEKLIERGHNVIEAERRVYGVDHCHLTIQATRTWGLTESIVGAVNYRAVPAPGDSNAPLRAATALGIAIGAPEMRDGQHFVPHWALKELGIEMEVASTLIRECQIMLSSTVGKAA